MQTKLVIISMAILLPMGNRVASQDLTACTHICTWDRSTFERIHAMPEMNRDVVMEMPVVIHQFSNFNDNQVMGLVTHLNNAFASNDLSIEFNLCQYIDYDTSISVSAADVEELVDLHHVPKAVNIYIADQAGLTGAVTVTSDVDENWIAISRFEPSTIVHEMGHYFGLLHTHNTFWGSELVNGSNCATAGDRFCDTPADPNLNGQVNNMCDYIGDETDANGEFYHPDPSNLMSYALHFCRSAFSEEQKSFMLNTIADKYGDYACITTSVRSPIHQIPVLISPNPSKGLVMIKLPDHLSDNPFKLNITNLSGQNIIFSDSPREGELDLTTLPTGIYFLSVSSQDFHSVSKIFIE